MATERPEYVNEFAKTKPIRTQIKRINNHYYLYECFTRYDKITKKPVKMSGKMLGTITEHGFVECKRREPRRKNEPTEFEKYMSQVKSNHPGVVSQREQTNSTEESPQVHTALNNSERNLPEEEQILDDPSLEESCDSIIESSKKVSPNLETINPPLTEDSSCQLDHEEEDRKKAFGEEQLLLENTTEVPVPTDGSFISESKALEPIEQGELPFSENDLGKLEHAASGTNGLTSENFNLSINSYIPPLKASKNVEVGMSLYIYSRTKSIRDCLMRNFPEGNFGIILYNICSIRATYDARFRRTQVNYMQSALSHIYPGLPLDKESLSMILSVLGCNREGIENYMKERMPKTGVFALVDGHRVLSVAKDLASAELGYDSKQRNKRQINLLYMYSLFKNPGTDEFRGIPTYYKQYCGGTTDDKGIADMQREIGKVDGDITVVADKGCVSQANIDEFVETGYKYVVPLDRGIKYAKDKVPDVASRDWYDMFRFRNRPIFVKTFHEEGFNVHIYMDLTLHRDEVNSEISRVEEENAEKYTALQKDIRRKKSNQPKLESAATRATVARKKAEANLKKAEEEFKKHSEKFERKTRELIDIGFERNKLEKGSTEFAKEDAKYQKVNSEAIKAASDMNEYKDLLAKAEINLKEKIEEEEVLSLKAKNNKEILDLLVAISEGKTDLVLSSGILSSKDVDQYALKATGDVALSTKEAGTITIITNRLEDDAKTIYFYYKVRENIEKYFNVYDNTLDFSASYMQDKASLEGWLFLNHVSSEITMTILNDIKDIGQTGNCSYKDFRTAMRNISADRVGNEWSINPIKEKTAKLCSLLNFNVEQVLNSFDWNYLDNIRKKHSKLSNGNYQKNIGPN